MLQLEKWAAGRFKPMAMLAQVVAISAKDCHEAILKSRQRWLLTTEEAAGITAGKWTSYYRRPLQLEGELLQFLFAPDRPGGATAIGDRWPSVRMGASGLLHEATQEWFANGTSLQDIDRANRRVDLIYRLVHVPLLKRLLRDEEAPPPNFRQWYGEGGFVFFMSVAMPCWLEFHQSPWALLLKARRGEFGALESLLRLDPEVRHDPAIRGQLFKLGNRHPEQRAELMKAELAGRTSPISLEQVKFSLAGLLMKWSAELEAVLKGELFFELLPQYTTPDQQRAVKRWIKNARKKMQRVGFKCRLNAPDIKALFDAVARDTGQGHVDSDFANNNPILFTNV